MREGTLLKVSSISFFVGLLSLYIFLPVPKDVPVSRAFVGEYVRVRGTISGITFSSSGVKFSLNDTTGEIDCFIYPSIVSELIVRGYDILGIKEGELIIISGMVREYRGIPEIVPKSPDDVVQ